MSDPDDIPGLAHFCEHMVFLGTKKVYTRKIDVLVEIMLQSVQFVYISRLDSQLTWYKVALFDYEGNNILPRFNLYTSM